MLNSVNKIRDQFQELFEAHEQLNSFYWGRFVDAYNGNALTHPSMVVTVQNATMSNLTTELTVTIFISDLVRDGRENYDDVQSDTAQILKDVYNVMRSKRWRSFITLGDNRPSAQWFEYKENESVFGWFADFTFSIQDPTDLCSIPLDSSYDLEMDLSPACAPVTILNADGSVNTTVASGGSYTIPASGDATAILNNTDGTTISTTAIPAGDSEIITAPDGSWTLENTLATEIDTGSIPSGDSDVIVAPDETINVVDQNDVLQQTLTFPVYENQQIDISTYCDDATAVLKNTDGTTLSTTNIPSGTSDDITAPDATFSINSTQVATIPSGDSDSIQVRKESGSDQIGSLQGQYWRVDDSVITLKDTSNNTLSTTNVPATEAQDITAPDGTVNVNKSDSTLISAQTVVSNGTTNYNVADSTAVLKDTAGATLSTTAIKATESEDITAPDADVENSDASYTDTIESGGTLVVPDSDVNVNSSLEGTVVSVKTIDINLTDGASTVTPDAVSVVGNTVTIQVPAGGGAPVGATLMKTGQTTSYRTGDDGDLEAGRATDFFTLASNNPFGNTNRFTDELGGTTYTNDIVIDWSTYDGSTVLGWYRVENGVNINWNNSIDNALLTSIGTFTSGWRLPNFMELASIINWESIYLLNYSPFNENGFFYFWTSTTRANNTSRAIAVYNPGYQFINASKTSTSNYRYFPCRTFTVTGTTLS